MRGKKMFWNKNKKDDYKIAKPTYNSRFEFATMNGLRLRGNVSLSEGAKNQSTIEKITDAEVMPCGGHEWLDLNVDDFEVQRELKIKLEAHYLAIKESRLRKDLVAKNILLGRK